jgi:hypothetical protein
LAEHRFIAGQGFSESEVMEGLDWERTWGSTSVRCSRGLLAIADWQSGGRGGIASTSTGVWSERRIGMKRATRCLCRALLLARSLKRVHGDPGVHEVLCSLRFLFLERCPVPRFQPVLSTNCEML